MKRNLLAPILLACLAPLAAAQVAPAVGPAKSLPGDAVIGPAGGVQQFPAIAAGAGVHLAAWLDHRSAFETLTTGVGTRDVYAQLLDAQGAPLAPLPFRVAGGLGRKRDVQVAWNGQHWLVTWRTDVPTQFSKAAALLGARVDTQGDVLDDPPLVIRSYAWSSTFSYGLGSDGTGWAVVMQGSQGGESNVEGWLVHPNGIVQQASSSVFSISYQLLDFQLGWDGSQYLLTWSDAGFGIRGYRATSTLGVLGSQLSIGGSDTSEASITSDGNGGFLVAFTRGGFVGSDIRYRRVSATGVTGTITTVNTSGVDPNTSAAVTWDGNTYTVVWSRGYYDPSTLHYARIDAAGALLDPGGIPLGHGAAASFPQVSSLGDGNTQVVWVDKVSTPPHPGDVSGARITTSGVDPAVAVASSTSRQGFPDLTPGPSGYMAVFTSERSGSVSILAQRLDVNGDAIDSEPVELGAKSTYGKPRVAWNGQHYLVVWHDLLNTSFVTDDLVLARRLAADGTPIDPAPFQVMEGADPSVAAAGDTFLVAARFAFTTQIFHINGARVDASGTVLDPAPFQIGGNFARWPKVASFGDRWLVAWQRNPTHDNPANSVFARVVFPDGSMASLQFLGGGPRPAVAASSSVGLVAWGGGDILLHRLAADGSLLGGAYAASSAPNSQTEAAVAWNGSEFVVAWEDQRNIPAYFDDRHDIYATRVSEAGLVLDPAGLQIAVSSDEEQMPAVVGRDGATLIAFGDHLVGLPHATVRISVVKVGDASTACSVLSYCSTSPNSVGSGAVMSHMGSTSVGANDLALVCSGAVPVQFGIFYYGSSTIQLPFGDGFRCVGGQTFRFPPQQTDAGGTAVRPVDLTSLPHGSQITAGSTWHFQFWYRDLAAGAAGFNLSDGLSLTFCD